MSNFAGKTMDTSLINTAQQLAAIDLSCTGTWIWNYQTGEILINPIFAHILGYTYEELTPLTISKWIKLIHPEDTDRIDYVIDHLERRTEMYEFDIRIMCKDGNYKWLKTRGKLHKTDEEGKPLLLAGIHLDVHELITSKIKLGRYLDMEKLLREISTDLICITPQTIDLKINAVIKALGEFFKVDRVFVFKMRNEDLIDNTHEWCAAGVPPSIDYMQAIPVGEFVSFQEKLVNDVYLHFPDVDGISDEYSNVRELVKSFAVKSLLIISLLQDKKITGFIGFDMTTKHKKWDENEINFLVSVSNVLSNAFEAAETQLQLLKANEKALESNNIKSAFLASINHELRTPLNHIIGFSEIIMELSTDNDIVSYSNSINNSGMELLYMIEDMFDLALYEGSKPKLRLQKYRLRDLCNALTTGFYEYHRQSEKSSHIELIFDFDEQFLSTIIKADKHKVIQIMQRLFRNAMKYTESGFIKVKGRISEDSRAEFSVQDTGIGIAEDFKEMLFDLFFRVDQSSTSKYGGLGIGLAIAKLLTSAMNGELTVDSQLGAGSTFTLSLPLHAN